MDKRLAEIIKTVTDMANGKYDTRVPIKGDDELAQLGQIVNQLGDAVEKRFLEIEALAKVTEKINQGIILKEVLDYTYDSFRSVIPYNRIGLALLEDEGKTLKAYWARSDSNTILLSNGYTSKMAGSSLQKIIRTGSPRIINSLKTYFKKHPKSETTQLILEEGIRSSLTFPLIVMGKPIGFIFFSSNKPNTYNNVHVELFMQIAGQLSMIVEKSRLYQQLLELNELKNKFLEIAVHDLRSPISLINIRLDLMTDGFLGDLTEKQKESLRGIRLWCDRMLTLIEDLLDVSAIESGELHLEKQSVELEPYLRECAEFNQDLAESKSANLACELAGNLGTVVMDPARIHQVLNNLISTTIKYSPQQAEVRLRAKRTRDYVEISINRQGQEAMEDNFPEIFNSFKKDPSKSVVSETSIGLGLAISKKMVTAHEGKIWAKKKPKEITIYFTLPLK